MLSDHLRDGLFLFAWFGLMTSVWLGWAQEAPPERARPLLGVGAVVGLLCAGGGGYLVARNWSATSALEGRYEVFGVVVALEVAAAGACCWWLARRGRQRWFALAVALAVATHFAPLGLLLDDPALVVLAVVQVVLVLLAARTAAARDLTPSCVVGAAMGSSLLASAAVAGVRWVPLAL